MKDVKGIIDQKSLRISASTHILICNSGFWIGFFVLLLCLVVHSSYVHRIAIQEPKIEYRPSALIYSLQGIFFGGYIQLFPLVACLPGFVFKKRTVHVEKIINKHKCMRNVAISFFSGAFVCVLPYALHTIVCNIIALPVDPRLYPEHEMSFWGIYNDIYYIDGGIWMYLFIASGMMICGGAYSLLFFVVSEFMCASDSALVIPSLMYHIWLRFGVYFDESGIPLPPFLISNDALTVEDAILSVMIYATIIVMLIFIYQKKWSAR